ncbi:MAG TPA: hypothetical protein VNA68_01625 [Candidatus Dormibacteraeota bacterium]|nr:hypothetical protein [Candidatus Dormibacteraeota bacterium]
MANPETYAGCANCGTSALQFNGADHCPNCDEPTKLKLYRMNPKKRHPGRGWVKDGSRRKLPSGKRGSDRADNMKSDEYDPMGPLI